MRGSTHLKSASLILSISFLLEVNTIDTENGVPKDPQPDSEEMLRKLTTSSNSKDIHFLAYTDPKHPTNFREIKVGDIATLEASGLKAGNVIILIDGWMSRNNSFMSNLLMSSGYLSQGTTNLIIVEYTLLSSNTYPLPGNILSYFGGLRNIKTIGSRIADLIQFLHTNKIIKSGKDIHMIGFSLGSHVAGAAGLFSSMRKLKVGRITALDPAGPFTKSLGKYRLSKKQAHFLDVIHSSYVLGAAESLGHVDFFVNGIIMKDIKGCNGGLDFVTTVGCSHGAAFVLYYKTIIASDKFTGCSCFPLPAKFTTACGDKPICQNPTVVGEFCPSTARGDFFVKTDVNLNYAQD